MRLFKSWVAVVVPLVPVGVFHGCAGGEESSGGAVDYDGACDETATCVAGLICSTADSKCSVPTNGVCGAEETWEMNLKCANVDENCLKADGSDGCGYSDVGAACICRKVAYGGICPNRTCAEGLACFLFNCRVPTNGVCSTEEGGKNLQCGASQDSCLKADGSAACGDSDVGDACTCSRVATNGVCSTEAGRPKLQCANRDEWCLKADGSTACGDSDVDDACKCSRIGYDGKCLGGSCQEGLECHFTFNICKVSYNGYCNATISCAKDLVCSSADSKCKVAYYRRCETRRTCAAGLTCDYLCKIGYGGECNDSLRCGPGLTCTDSKCVVQYGAKCWPVVSNLTEPLKCKNGACLLQNRSTRYVALCEAKNDNCICGSVADGQKCWPTGSNLTRALACETGACLQNRNKQAICEEENKNCICGKVADDQKCWPAGSSLQRALACENGACLQDRNKQAICMAENDTCICGKAGYNGACISTWVTRTCAEGLACSSDDSICKVGYNSTCNDTMTCAKPLLACSTADSKCKVADGVICGHPLPLELTCANGSCICEEGKCECGVKA